MTNRDIAKNFQLLGSIMELHGENPYKVRSYQNAYLTLRKLDRPLREMSEEQIAGIKGVGQAIAAKIREMIETGRMRALDKYLDMTPPGVREMLRVEGFGPKKVRAVWRELGIESIGELRYAINENRLVELKGFGTKTQEDLRRKLDFFQRFQHQFHYAALEDEAGRLRDALAQRLSGARVETTGALRRAAEVLEAIELLAGTTADIAAELEAIGLQATENDDEAWRASSPDGYPVRIYQCSPDRFGAEQFRHSAALAFQEAFQKVYGVPPELPNEEDIFAWAGLPYIVPEMREEPWALERAAEGRLPGLLEFTDIKGVLHVHTTYSDGANTLREMALGARELGFAYLGVTDHSQAAFYANGLTPERVLEQVDEIDRLNQELTPFRIFKGIECDILNDGALDYDAELRGRFDFIIASVHSNLRMDEAKATQRLVAAIENPHTRILGHPTGRLLLSRPGYPINHRRVIDACAANGVAIELNANPYRLDLDWRWIPQALEKGVFIAVNPDAHSLAGLRDTRYGVLAARKGGLDAEHCLNCFDAAAFEAWLRRKD